VRIMLVTIVILYAQFGCTILEIPLFDLCMPNIIIIICFNQENNIAHDQMFTCESFARETVREHMINFIVFLPFIVGILHFLKSLVQSLPVVTYSQKQLWLNQISVHVDTKMANHVYSLVFQYTRIFQNLSRLDTPSSHCWYFVVDY